MRIELASAGFSVGKVDILGETTLAMGDKKITVLLGPNGAGKSTILRLLSGAILPSIGQVLLQGKPLNDYSLAQRSRCLGVLTQDNTLDFPFSVAEVIGMGQIPHDARPGLRILTETIVDLMIERFGLAPDRIYTTLSGGEKQLVHIARVLVQVWGLGSGACVLLDEPMAALDLRHQKLVVSLLLELANAGTSQVIVMHDINLAAEFADEIVLVSGGAVVARGAPEVVMTADTLGQTFATEMLVVNDSVSGQKFYRAAMAPWSKR